MLSKNQVIGKKYTVLFFIKEGAYADSYRVKDEAGQVFFLKMFDYSKLHPTQINPTGQILEIELLKQVKHPNVVGYRDSGIFQHEERQFAYLVLDFISGETLAERIKRERRLNPYDAKAFITNITEGVKGLHELPEPVIHNDITPHNIMLDLTDTKLPVPILIDFGHARTPSLPKEKTHNEADSLYYTAPESFGNDFSQRSDIFSVGALFYHAIFGMPPWYASDLSKYRADRTDIEEIIWEERLKPLKMPDIPGFSAAKDVIDIIKTALQPNPDSRFQTAAELLQALRGEVPVQVKKRGQPLPPLQRPLKPGGKPRGFAAIAGMATLKDILHNDVILPLHDPKLYEEYGLTIPNGMLLFGPPGCGKTFFAERFAEEVGYNFISVKPSDLASIYVHGAQEKIGQLFKDARENAPTILFIDELDAFVPRREGDLNHSYASEVNEFLAQMTNSSAQGVFIIGASNRPEKIDSALLRTGRIDRLYYVGPPDRPARLAMFEILLRARPMEDDINYEELADLTENYVSSDIEFLVNQAARTALRNRTKISQSILKETIQTAKPSVPLADIKKYEVLKEQLEGGNPATAHRRIIGFRREE